MSTEERALRFSCQGELLYGVASLPAGAATRGVLIVVGGPQYRAGSHRQFTLLARSLAAAGIPAMRFDYRGMGDSEGQARDFEAVAEDLRAAIDCFMANVPGLREVVLWGLCDAASAAMMYAGGDARVAGLAVLNPWVRTGSGLAKARLKHYYRARLLDRALWKKIASGRFDVRAALGSLLNQVLALRRPRQGSPDEPAPLPDRMHAGLARFQGQVLVITCGGDLTAREFLDLCAASADWKAAMAAPRVRHHQLALADHTCSTRVWRDQVAAWTAEWVHAW